MVEESDNSPLSALSKNDRRTLSSAADCVCEAFINRRDGTDPIVSVYEQTGMLGHENKLDELHPPL